MKKRLCGILLLALLSFGCTADVLGRIKGFDVLQLIQSQPEGEAITKARNIGRVLATIEALILAFVCWYRIQAGAAWLFLVLPAVAVVAGCAGLMLAWRRNETLRQDTSELIACLRRNLAAAILGTGTLLAAAILAAVVAHIITD